jgi:hypothetical protein
MSYPVCLEAILQPLIYLNNISWTADNGSSFWFFGGLFAVGTVCNKLPHMASGLDGFFGKG